jgi:hypothetical protein
MSRGGESEDPAWLTESTTAAAVAVGSNKEVQKAVTNAATDHVKQKYLPGAGDKDIEAQVRELESNIEPEELQSMKKMNTILRLSFTLVAIAMCLVAVFQILDTPSIEIFFLAGYVMVFSVLMCCFEASLPGISNIIARNFGFLYSLGGRLIFSLFVGFLCFSLKIWGIVSGSAMMLVLILNIYVLIAFPKYEEWLRTKHFQNTGAKA